MLAYGLQPLRSSCSWTETPVLDGHPALNFYFRLIAQPAAKKTSKLGGVARWHNCRAAEGCIRAVPAVVPGAQDPVPWIQQVYIGLRMQDARDLREKAIASNLGRTKHDIKQYLFVTVRACVQ